MQFSLNFLTHFLETENELFLFSPINLIMVQKWQAMPTCSEVIYNWSKLSLKTLNQIDIFRSMGVHTLWLQHPGLWSLHMHKRMKFCQWHHPAYPVIHEFWRAGKDIGKTEIKVWCDTFLPHTVDFQGLWVRRNTVERIFPPKKTHPHCMHATVYRWALWTKSVLFWLLFAGFKICFGTIFLQVLILWSQWK